MSRTEKTTKDDQKHRDVVRAKLLKYGFEQAANSYQSPTSVLIATVLALGERVAVLEKRLGIRAKSVPPDLYLQSRTSSRGSRPRAKKNASERAG